MPNSLRFLIDRLKQTKIISSHPAYIETLDSINKFADNDFSKAYLLGLFFKTKLDSDNLPPDDKSFLIDTIQSKNLGAYFYLKTKPEGDYWEILTYIFIVGGFIAIVLGTLQLINGDFWYGLGTKYLVPIIREGGYKIILGLVFLIGGLFRLRHEIKKKQFLKSFLAPTNNSN